MPPENNLSQRVFRVLYTIEWLRLGWNLVTTANRTHSKVHNCIQRLLTEGIPKRLNSSIPETINITRESRYWPKIAGTRSAQNMKRWVKAFRRKSAQFTNNWRMKLVPCCSVVSQPVPGILSAAREGWTCNHNTAFSCAFSGRSETF